MDIWCSLRGRWVIAMGEGRVGYDNVGHLSGGIVSGDRSAFKDITDKERLRTIRISVVCLSGKSISSMIMSLCVFRSLG